MTTFSQQLHEILADFMEAIEEVEAEIEGSPSKADLAAVDNVYSESVVAITHLVEERELEIKEEGWRDGITFAYTIVVTAKPDKHLELLLESALDNYPAELRQRLGAK